MKYELDDIKYDVVINRKNNKNTYIRVKDNVIYVNTNYFATKLFIKGLLDNNKDSLRKMINSSLKKQQMEEVFYFLGKKYDIIIVPSFKIEIIEDKIFVQSKEYLDKWLKKQIKLIFQNRLDINYNLFEESIPYPNLKVRKMKTRWGVCNRKNNNVTLNTELIKYGYEQIDYVIIHELSHFVHFNHSKDFWSLVSKYCKNHKNIRKSLRD